MKKLLATSLACTSIAIGVIPAASSPSYVYLECKGESSSNYTFNHSGKTSRSVMSHEAFITLDEENSRIRIGLRTRPGKWQNAGFNFKEVIFQENRKGEFFTRRVRWWFNRFTGDYIHVDDHKTEKLNTYTRVSGICRRNQSFNRYF